VGFFVAQQYLYTMKIRLTESQISRVILNESTSSKVLHSDNILELYVMDYDTKKGSFVPSNKDVDTQIFGGIQNKTDKPIIFTFNKSNSSGLSRIGLGYDKIIEGNNLSTLNLGIVIQPYDIASFTFTIDSTKKDFFVQNFGVFYTQPPSQPIYKTINIPIYSESWKSSCKLVINQTHLNSAIAWWKKWLNNSTTKDKFSKSFKYDKSTVEKHFVEYNKILSQIKFEYTYSNKPNGGWVMTAFKKGYNIPVIINCRIANKYRNEDSISFFIHEIQHILDSYHRFYPYDYNDYKHVYDKIMADIGFTKEINSTSLVKYLISVGFGPEQSKEVIRHYSWRLTVDEIHLKNPNEVMSSLTEIRRSLNLTPNQKITKEMLIANTDNSEVLIFIHQWLYSKKTLNDFLNFSNSIAMGKPNTTNTNLA